jgi:hypothetical protein
LRSVKFRYEVQQSFPNSDALIIREHDKPTYSIIPCLHSDMDNSNESLRKRTRHQRLQDYLERSKKGVKPENPADFSDVLDGIKKLLV